jgi:phytoene dehydrogenase-like protein
MSSPAVDVVVVGAGLAGLVCALELERAHLTVTVLEAGDEVGGRIRTDEVDGYRCDRGFQLLNPSYPAVREMVDVEALELRQFAAGVALADTTGARHAGPRVVADPVRAPRYLAATLRSGYLRPVELARLAAWAAPALGSVERIRADSDEPLSSSLDRAGVTGKVRRDIWDPFFTGVLAEDTGASSTRFARLLTRSFLLGRPGVPALGMSALPRQLAGSLARPVQTGVAALGVAPQDSGSLGQGARVHSEAGSLTARAVVVATDPASAVRLLGLPEVRMNGLVTYWFSADDAPRDLDLLVVDPRGRSGGPVVNAAVMSNVAPSYAPPGRVLVQATTLAAYAATESEVRAQLAAMFPSHVARWEVVTRHLIGSALPFQRPGSSFRQGVDLGGGVFVAGDHRDTASIQGAMVSGRRAARSVVESLASGAKGGMRTVDP